MKNAAALADLVGVQLRLAYRVRIAFFFSFLLPLGFFFVFTMMFARGQTSNVEQLLGPLLAFLIVANAILGMSGQLVTMREQDVLRVFYLSGLRAWELLTAKAISAFLILIANVALQLFLAWWLFDIHINASLWEIFVAVAVGAAALYGIGMIVASTVNTMQEAQIVNQTLFMVMVLFTGITVPLSNFPMPLRKLVGLLPPTQIVKVLNGLILGDPRLELYWHQLLILVLIFLVAFGCALRLFRWDSENRITWKSRAIVVGIILPFLLAGIFL